MVLCLFFCLIIRLPPSSTRTDTLLSLHDSLPFSTGGRQADGRRRRALHRHHLRPRRDGRDDEAAGRGDGRRDARAIWQAEAGGSGRRSRRGRSEEHTSELQSLMRISYAVFCVKKKKNNKYQHHLTLTTTDESKTKTQKTH